MFEVGDLVKLQVDETEYIGPFRILGVHKKFVTVIKHPSDIIDMPILWFVEKSIPYKFKSIEEWL